ncbi:NAD-dependent epimerase/dehydratase family protein [Psychroserpens jangbogonensis]|uniref:NAD-dependent epimerase/dehydratase family protein n=1 Tax=Psychroserpens jangbogonensis TaxID=1484460 RepID=UPI00053D7EC4|nr:NAD-dependent epimerase/dehydratase family protein [Psychroserpens jangbogonensis]
MILVTGGTGLVGSHLLYKLVSENEHVKAIYRRAHTLERVKHVFSYYTENYKELYDKIEWVEADLNDVPSLELAFKDVDYVYHCAALVSFEPNKYYQLRNINIDGTANIVNLSVSNNIKKLCYVSSIAAIGHEPNPNQLITEQTEWNPEEDNSVYAITKYGAEMEVWRGTQEGVPAIIINPGIILGPGYWKGGSSGNLFRLIHKGLKYYTSGTSGYVGVWDVCDIMFKLMHSDLENERYILISENLSFNDFQKKVAQALNVNPAKKEASTFILEIGWRLDWLMSKLFGKRRKISKQLAKSVRTKTIYDNSKIKNALQIEFRTIENSIAKVSKYYLKDTSKL